MRVACRPGLLWVFPMQGRKRGRVEGSQGTAGQTLGSGKNTTVDSMQTVT